jgi:hypothetical protein
MFVGPAMYYKITIRQIIFYVTISGASVAQGKSDNKNNLKTKMTKILPILQNTVAY